MGQPETSLRSMYAAIRLARLVFSVRARIQARINGRECPRKSQLSVSPAFLEEQVNTGVNQQVRSLPLVTKANVKAEFSKIRIALIDSTTIAAKSANQNM